MVESLAPREVTVRKLFALSMNRCAFPGCTTPLIHPETRTVLAEICHIRAQSERGPRFEESQTPEQRHGFENLLLMCGVHHKVIDAPENLNIYTTEYLVKLKADHEATARRSGFAPEPLTEELIHTILRSTARYESNTIHMDFRHATFRAGGEGGGFGGGGGSGGVITIVGTTHPPPGAALELNGEDATGFGGGGGGAGVVRFFGREATPEDIASGLRISTMFLANAVSISEGLLNVLGGVWSHCALASVPTEAVLNLVCVVEVAGLTPHTLIRLDTEVLAPTGKPILCEPRDIEVPPRIDLTARIPLLQMLRPQVDEYGTWTIRIKSGPTLLATHAIEFRQRTAGS